MNEVVSEFGQRSIIEEKINVVFLLNNIFYKQPTLQYFILFDSHFQIIFFLATDGHIGQLL